MQELKRLPTTKLSVSRRRLTWGIGVNDADYLTNPSVSGKTKACPVYVAWSGMLQRGYSEKYKALHPSYIGVTVCDEWLIFSNFSRWYANNYVNGYDLDKDIKLKGSKLYSPNTCLYVPQEINKLFTDHKAARGALPLGVSAKGNRYRARVNREGVSVALGSFSTPQAAHEAYKVGKNESIMMASAKYPEFGEYLKQHIYEGEPLIK